MEQERSGSGFMKLLERPAFLTEAGKILETNEAALQCGIVPGAELMPMVASGAQELAELTEGSLCLTLHLPDTDRNASVRRLEDGRMLFLLEEPETADVMRALALASLHLRRPLAETMNAASALQEVWESTDPEQRRWISEVNRGLYQLLRVVGNMSAAGQMNRLNLNRKETTEASAFFWEILEKSQTLAEAAGKRIVFTVPEKRIFLGINQQQIERAVYNLLSNALRYTPKGGEIRVSLKQTGKMLVLRIADSGDGLDRAVRENLFERYRREPGLEDGRNGLGLGLMLVRRAASDHGGALFVGPGPDGGTVAALSMEIRMPKNPVLNSPVLRLDYSGERDHALLELSGELPWELYEDL